MVTSGIYNCMCVRVYLCVYERNNENAHGRQWKKVSEILEENKNNFPPRMPYPNEFLPLKKISFITLNFFVQI